MPNDFEEIIVPHEHLSAGFYDQRRTYFYKKDANHLDKGANAAVYPVYESSSRQETPRLLSGVIIKVENADLVSFADQAAAKKEATINKSMAKNSKIPVHISLLNGRNAWLLEKANGQNYQACLEAWKIKLTEQSSSKDALLADADFRILQYLQALKKLADNQIVHRDLKADNVFYDEAVGFTFVDFGEAKIRETRQEDVDACPTNAAYGAPEQFFGLKTSLYKSDLFTSAKTIIGPTWGLIANTCRLADFDDDSSPLAVITDPGGRVTWTSQSGVFIKDQSGSDERFSLLCKMTEYNSDSRIAVAEAIKKMKGIIAREKTQNPTYNKRMSVIEEPVSREEVPPPSFKTKHPNLTTALAVALAAGTVGAVAGALVGGVAGLGIFSIPASAAGALLIGVTMFVTAFITTLAVSKAVEKLDYDPKSAGLFCR